MSTAEIDILTADSDPTRVRAWLEAVHLGFHGNRISDSQFEHWLADARSDKPVLRQVADPDDTDGWPVATFTDFDKTINAGREVIPASLITDVTVRPDQRRRGLLRRMMTDSLTATHARGVPVATLTVTEATIYGRFGFGVATTANRIEVDTTERFAILPAALQDHGRVRMVSPTAGIEAINNVFDTFHTTQRGSIARPTFYQDWLSGTYDWDGDGPDKKLRHAIHLAADGTIDGYVCFSYDRDPRPHVINVQDMVALTPQAHLGLWDFLGGIDLVGTVKFGNARLDDPLPWAMSDRRGYKVVGSGDRIWSRILDPVRCLSARPWEADGATTLRIVDPMGFADGTYRIESSGGEAQISATEAMPEITLDVSALGGLWLGGATVAQLQGAGRLSGDPAAVEAFAELTDLATPPYSDTFF